jgi:hypothetical protein
MHVTPNRSAVGARILSNGLPREKGIAQFRKKIPDFPFPSDYCGRKRGRPVTQLHVDGPAHTRGPSTSAGGNNISPWPIFSLHTSQSKSISSSSTTLSPCARRRRRHDAAARHGPAAAAAAGWTRRAAALERHPAAHGPTRSSAAAAVRSASAAAAPGAAPAADVGPGTPAVAPGLVRPGAPADGPAAPAGRVLRGPSAGAGAPSCGRPCRAQRGQDALDRGPAVLDGRELRLQLLRIHRRGRFLRILDCFDPIQHMAFPLDVS